MLTLQAPAKLNLFLHIIGQRPDGYHLLQAVFMRIDWYDTLHFERKQGGLITREDLINTTGQQLPPVDLTLRAARALQQASGTSWGAHIGLEKRIPSEAGMGGGSSDAATTLLALNHLWETNLPQDSLMALGLKLGADVPFFLQQSHAWVAGIGEQITPINLPFAQFLVVKPAQGVSTPAIFSSNYLERSSNTATIEGFAAWTRSTHEDAQQQCLDRFGCNVMQPVAMQLCPQIAQALDWFAGLGLIARMTGSGSAVFAQVPPNFDLNAAPSLPAGWQIRLCSNQVVQ